MARRREPIEPVERFALAQRAAADVPGGVLALSPQEMMSIQASRRADSAGTPLGMLTPATRYQERVVRLWDFYGSDPLFRRLVDRVTEFSASGSTWEVGRPASVTGNVEESIESEGAIEAQTRESDQEDEFWNAWSAQINMLAPNVLPTLDEVQRWAFKHMQLSGMFVLHYRLGKVKVGRREYIAPTEISCFPASSVVLQRKNSLFMEEEIYVAVPKLAQDLKQGGGGTRLSIGMMEGEPRTALHTGITASGSYFKLDPMRLSHTPDPKPLEMVGKYECYVVKYNWTPGDLVTVGRPGQYGQTGASIYPLVPYYPLTPQFLLRQKLFASDLAILDGILQYIMWFKIGTKERAAKSGDIEKVRALIEPQLFGPSRAFYLPEWVNIELLFPKTDTLLSEAKYFQSTSEIMQCFPPDQMVTTQRGHLPIERVEVGDRVLTHRGRWRTVLQTHARHYDGELIGLRSGGNRWIWCTPGHSVLSRYRKKNVSWHSTQRAWRWSVSPGTSPEPALWRLSAGLEAGDLVLVPADVADYEDREPRLALYAEGSVHTEGRVALRRLGRAPTCYERIENPPHRFIRVWEALGAGPRMVHEIACITGQTAGAVRIALSWLRRAGAVARCGVGPRQVSPSPRQVSPSWYLDLPASVPVDPILAYVIGLYLAEGCVLKRPKIVEGLAFAFHRNEEAFHQAVRETLQTVFGVSTTTAVIGNTVRMAVYSKILAETFAREFGARSSGKRVPRWLIESPRATRAAWLRGLFHGDGHRRGTRWTLSTVSLELALATVETSRSLGYAATISQYPGTPARLRSGQFSTAQEVYHVAISIRGASFDALMDGAVPDAISANDECWVSLKTPRTKQYVGIVHDLTVDEDHSFTVEGHAVGNSFGLLSIRTSGSSRERMERMNIAGFEEMCGGYQQHWKLAMEQLAWRIRRLNPEKLKRQPRWVPQPLNTQDAASREALVELMKYGRISGQTLLRAFQLDDKAELDRIISEQARNVTEVWDDNAPIAYRQVATGPTGKTSTTGIPASLQRGRPRKGSPRLPRGGATEPPKAPAGGGEKATR